MPTHPTLSGEEIAWVIFHKMDSRGQRPEDRDDPMWEVTVGLKEFRWVRAPQYDFTARFRRWGTTWTRQRKNGICWYDMTFDYVVREYQAESRWRKIQRWTLDGDLNAYWQWFGLGVDLGGQKNVVMATDAFPSASRLALSGVLAGMVSSSESGLLADAVSTIISGSVTGSTVLSGGTTTMGGGSTTGSTVLSGGTTTMGGGTTTMGGGSTTMGGGTTTMGGGTTTMGGASSGSVTMSGGSTMSGAPSGSVTMSGGSTMSGAPSGSATLSGGSTMSGAPSGGATMSGGSTGVGGAGPALAPGAASALSTATPEVTAVTVNHGLVGGTVAKLSATTVSAAPGTAVALGAATFVVVFATTSYIGNWLGLIPSGWNFEGESWVPEDDQRRSAGGSTDWRLDYLRQLAPEGARWPGSVSGNAVNVKWLDFADYMEKYIDLRYTETSNVVTGPYHTRVSDLYPCDKEQGPTKFPEGETPHGPLTLPQDPQKAVKWKPPPPEEYPPFDKALTEEELNRYLGVTPKEAPKETTPTTPAQPVETPKPSAETAPTTPAQPVETPSAETAPTTPAQPVETPKPSATEAPSLDDIRRLSPTDAEKLASLRTLSAVLTAGSQLNRLGYSSSDARYLTQEAQVLLLAVQLTWQDARVLVRLLRADARSLSDAGGRARTLARLREYSGAKLGNAAAIAGAPDYDASALIELLTRWPA